MLLHFIATGAPPMPEPQKLADFLTVFFYLVGIVTAGVVLYRHWRPAPLAPQPLSVIAHEKLATTEQLKEVHGRIKREREELNLQLALHAAEIKTLREKLDDDIGDLHQRIDRVPDRVIALLRQTKGLIE